MRFSVWSNDEQPYVSDKHTLHSHYLVLENPVENHLLCAALNPAEENLHAYSLGADFTNASFVLSYLLLTGQHRP